MNEPQQKCESSVSVMREGKDFTISKPWVGLTDEEIETIVNNNTYDDSGYDIWCHGKGIARDIEAKLKEKNT